MMPTNFRVQLPTLSREDHERIDTLAAHFVEDSELLLGLSSAITEAVKRYVARDEAKRAQRGKPL